MEHDQPGEIRGPNNVVVEPPVQESSAPVIDMVAPKAERAFYALGKTTHSSTITHPEFAKVGGEGIQKPTVDRSFFLRRARAKLLEEFKKVPHSDREKRKKILEQGANRDRIAKEFLNQGTVRVTFPELGEQSAKFTVLNSATENLNGEETSHHQLIVIIPGISNELDSIEAHAQTVASFNRRVMGIGYPEGYAGNVTEQFTDAIVSTGDLSYHSQFFKEAVNELTKNEPEIELWGLSTGSPIVAEMLSDPEFAERVSKAVLIGPAASVDQSVMSQSIGGLKDMKRTLTSNFSDMIPSFVWFNGKKGSEDTSDQARKRKKIFSSLQKSISRRSKYWDTMRVRDGGKIAVFAGGRDDITKNYKAIDEFSKNPQVVAQVLPNETHTSIFNNPEVIQEILSK